jgi:hypothetical protein
LRGAIRHDFRVRLGPHGGRIDAAAVASLAGLPTLPRGLLHRLAGGLEALALAAVRVHQAAGHQGRAGREDEQLFAARYCKEGHAFTAA